MAQNTRSHIMATLICTRRYLTCVSTFYPKSPFPFSYCLGIFYVVRGRHTFGGTTSQTKVPESLDPRGNSKGLEQERRIPVRHGFRTARGLQT